LGAEAERIDKYLQTIRIDKEKTGILAASKRIVAFSPHPDDSEIIAGGFIAGAIDRGSDVKVVVVSDDRMSLTSMTKPLPMEDIAALRKKEELEAMSILRVKNIDFLEYVDSQVPEPRVLSRDFMRIMRSFQPDLAVTVDPFLLYEAHPDHINTGRGVLQAALFHAYPYIVRDAKVSSAAPVLALGATALPNAVISIDQTIDKKVKAVLAHKSQWPDPRKMEERIRTLSARFGKLAGSSYGEPFKVLLPDEIHLGLYASLS
jgi:LmbE family N-acetylglucosaminyl deacetylase